MLIGQLLIQPNTVGPGVKLAAVQNALEMILHLSLRDSVECEPTLFELSVLVVNAGDMSPQTLSPAGKDKRAVVTWTTQTK